MSYRDYDHEIDASLDELIGKTLVSCDRIGDELTFVTDAGERYRMTHFDDCCESVTLDDVDGDLSDLIGSPLLVAEERTDLGDRPAKGEYDDSYTWTFYTLRTVKGTVDLKWYGTSNGYYSESVDFVRVQP